MLEKHHVEKEREERKAHLEQNVQAENENESQFGDFPGICTCFVISATCHPRAFDALVAPFDLLTRTTSPRLVLVHQK
jgi:hypothetical protein